MHMRVSEGIPRGRKIFLYHPELFKEHDEVIIYTREEFKRNYLAMKEFIDYSMKLYYHFDQDTDSQLLGYWLQIMERIHMIQLNMDSFFENKPAQSYLDRYIENQIVESEDILIDTASKVAAESLGVNWL
jgi:hypothetical protein